MSTKIINKVGIEVEVLLRDKKGLVVAAEMCLPHDDFPLLAEIRAAPGTTVAETYGNFIKALTEFKMRLPSDLTLDLSGGALIDHALYKKCLAIAGSKSLPECRNIYGTDISKRSDTVIEEGIIKGHKVSCGLHIHFSSAAEISVESATSSAEYTYDPVNIPLTIGDSSLGSLGLYARRLLPGVKTPSTTKRCETFNRLTMPCVREFVRALDNKFWKQYRPSNDILTRYRDRGYYEIKCDGRFEYRSLPFDTHTLADMESIITYAFSLFNSLES